jgi:spore coat protein CotH
MGTSPKRFGELISGRAERVVEKFLSARQRWKHMEPQIMAEMENLRERDRIMKSIVNFDKNAHFLPPIMPRVHG